MRSFYLLTIGTAAIGCAASASVQTINSNNARRCYLAAEAEERTSEALAACDLALGEFAGERDTLVATHVNRGIVRMFKGNDDAAMADFDAAIALNADQPEAWLNKGVALLRSPGRADDAVSAFDTALLKGTRRPALAHLGRAYAHESNGDARAAYRDYKRAEMLAPGWTAPRRELRRFRVVRQGKEESSGTS